jgi:hypothetical protein
MIELDQYGPGFECTRWSRQPGGSCNAQIGFDVPGIGYRFDGGKRAGREICQGSLQAGPCQKCILHPHHAGRAATAGLNDGRAVPYNQFNEPYYGASQGYAPGEKQQFLESVMRRD